MLSRAEADDVSSALELLLRQLADAGYRFITPTPLTHQRVLAHRSGQMATTLRDIFGWNMPFSAASYVPMTRQLLAAMRGAGVLQTRGDLLQCAVRVSSLDDDLFVHSGFPTTQDDAVFFGPDTYRFARFIQQGVAGVFAPGRKALRILDIGCGSGAGGVVATHALTGICPLEVVMNDINPLALEYTSVNAACAGIPIKPALGNALRAVKGDFDLIISNPPYMQDAAQRAYRHGGAGLGRALSVRIGEEAIARLAPGGHLLLYTGVAIVGGLDAFFADMQPLLKDGQLDWSYSEIDPDVFGEELEQTAYAHVERIAAVGLTVTRKPGVS
jgi:methylase of polypeptide subunit release factors